jgi:dCMP deaminase
LREQLGIPSGERHEICRGLHAEQNAILQASYYGVQISNSVIYTTNHPCVMCAKMIINCGIKKVYYFEDYPDPLAAELLSEAEIELVKLDF